jgi:hypothetical protein
MTFKISIFKSVNQAYVEYVCDNDWQTMARDFCGISACDSKDSVPLFNLVEFKSITDPTVELARRYKYIDGQRSEDGAYELIAGKVRRCKENVVGLHGIVLDIDALRTIEQAVELLDGIEYVLYTTYNHTWTNNKFRVIIPFSKPLLAEDIAGRMMSIKQTFPGVDNASFSISQCFYFHSANNVSDAFSIWNQGAIIDPYDFEYAEPRVYVEPEVKPMPDDAVLTQYREAVLRSLLSCSGLHYNSDKQFGVLTLVNICKSIDLDFTGFVNVVSKIMAPDSNSLGDHSLLRNAWTGWQGNRARRETVNKFIDEYNGHAVKIDRQKIHQVQYSEYLEELEVLEQLRQELERRKHNVK